MKRINVESGINIIINDSNRIPAKGFEVVKVRTFQTLGEGMKLFKILFSKYPSVYMYKTKAGYMVEFKTYVETFDKAQALKEEIEGIIEVFENEE